MLNLPSSAFPQFSPKNFAFAAPLLRSEFRTKMKENKIHLKCSLRLTKIYLEVTVRVPVINCLVENKPGKSIQIRSLFSAKLFHFNFFVSVIDYIQHFLHILEIQYHINKKMLVS